MRTLIAITQVTLDGVMQGPGGPEEDPSSGFNTYRLAGPLPCDSAAGSTMRTPKTKGNRTNEEP